MERLENLERIAWNELKKMNAAYAGKEEFTAQDCEKFDKLTHALKCLLTATAMKEAEEYEQEGFSGRRGRSPSTGRYVSRSMGDQSYEQGYSSGYSDAMSGHYPLMYPQMPNQRW